MKQILIILMSVSLYIVAQTNLPPTPLEYFGEDFSPPEFPTNTTVVVKTETVYVIPEHVIVKFQTRDSLTETNWTDILIFKSSKQQGFYRVVIEK